MPLRIFTLLLLTVALVAGCGRRGALEAPGRVETNAVPAPSSPALPGASEDAPAAAASSTDVTPGAAPALDPASPGAQEPAKARPSKAPNRHFLLDPLL